ncbi:histidine phosphatase family protein [Nesterenkonia sp. MY13]|uniref:Histidine phosphatase family protein n=1 Tax=Nesterenkonia sedimenti TaxID=1463632 RepID=A0A7X8YDZ1_9MICC|nr:histidine phosphatase family protein [Nesterenkonia sedimenti]NLS09866.1 histidine phosphatase family protein [Nesterenkonia sedimenti]
MMPLDLILIRHGESEGNLAGALARQGDESHFTDAFVTTPGREWQLTETGQKQAEIVGRYLREAEFPTNYPQLREEETARFYCSPYVRTRQTAGHLGLEYQSGESVRWYQNRAIRERDWGDIETRPRREFEESPMFELNARKKAIDPLYWRPPGGESICDVAENRVRNFLDTLHRECSDQTVLAVTHGEFIRATRLVLERVDDETYTSWETNPEMRIRNCEIFHYTRVAPELLFSDRPHAESWDGGLNPGDIAPRIAFLQRSYPHLEDDGITWTVSSLPWRQINYDKPTNDDLKNAP